MQNCYLKFIQNKAYNYMVYLWKFVSYMEKTEWGGVELVLLKKSDKQEESAVTE